MQLTGIGIRVFIQAKVEHGIARLNRTYMEAPTYRNRFVVGIVGENIVTVCEIIGGVELIVFTHFSTGQSGAICPSAEEKGFTSGVVIVRCEVNCQSEQRVRNF